MGNLQKTERKSKWFSYLPREMPYQCPSGDRLVTPPTEPLWSKPSSERVGTTTMSKQSTDSASSEAPFLFGIFFHSAKDPRYFFGTNRSNDNYKKYMTKRQWCMTTGRGLRFKESSNHHINARGYTEWMRTDRYHGLKLDWQKDIYQLILDIHAADPKEYVSPKPE